MPPRLPEIAVLMGFVSHPQGFEPQASGFQPQCPFPMSAVRIVLSRIWKSIRRLMFSM